MTKNIGWPDFTKVYMRVGAIVQVDDFLEARSPAYRIYMDFGSELGIGKSSVQITKWYPKERFLGK